MHAYCRGLPRTVGLESTPTEWSRRPAEIWGERSVPGAGSGGEGADAHPLPPYDPVDAINLVAEHQPQASELECARPLP